MCDHIMYEGNYEDYVPRIGTRYVKHSYPCKVSSGHFTPVKCETPFGTLYYGRSRSGRTYTRGKPHRDTSGTSSRIPRVWNPHVSEWQTYDPDQEWKIANRIWAEFERTRRPFGNQNVAQVTKDGKSGAVDQGVSPIRE